MKILVLIDDVWHPGEVIRRGFRPLEALGYELDYVAACKDILTADMLNDYEVIVNARGDCHSPGNSSAPWFEDGVTAVMPNDFAGYVRTGHGFLSLHAGNTFACAARSDMTEFLGNEFITHPPQCTVTARAVKPHPIVNGIEPFSFRDEHYEIRLLADDADVFLTTESGTEAGIQPAGYTRSIGKGRLVVLTPGHNCAVLSHPSYTKLLANALEWAAGRI